MTATKAREVFHVNVEDLPLLKHLGLLALVGAIVGLGQMLSEVGRLSWRVIVGRFMTSAGLGVAAGGLLAWLPDLPLIAQCGIAAGMASLGTSGFTLLFQRFISRG